MIRSEGSLSLYKGFVPLLWRDVPGWGAYFWSYEFLKEKFGINNESMMREPSMLNTFILMWCGGVAGQISWMVGYPFDIVKTMIQCEESRYIRMREVVAELYRTQGVTGFFKGFSPTLLRSFVVNAITLPSYDYLNRKYMD